MGKKLIIKGADFSQIGFLENLNVTNLAGNVVVGTRWTPSYNETRTADWCALFGEVDLSQYLGIYSKINVETVNGYYLGTIWVPNGTVADSNSVQTCTFDLTDNYKKIKINLKSTSENTPSTPFVPQASLSAENYIKITLIP